MAAYYSVVQQLLESVCAPDVALFISRLIFLFTSCSSCLHVLSHIYLHYFNVLLLLLHYGPHGSLPCLWFWPIIGSGSQSATPFGGKNFRIFYLSHKTFLFSRLPLGSTLLFVSFVVDENTWTFLSIPTLDAARTMYSFSAWLALSALEGFYKVYKV